MPTLDFKGKQHIHAHHLIVPYRPLEPDDKRSLHPAGADDNLIIHGDNTGNEGWVYNDRVNSPLMRQWLKENGPVDNERG